MKKVKTMTIILEIAIIMIIRTATTTNKNNTYNGHHHDSDITSARQKKLKIPKKMQISK